MNHSLLHASLCTGPDFRVDSPVEDWDREEGQVGFPPTPPGIVKIAMG